MLNPSDNAYLLKGIQNIKRIANSLNNLKLYKEAIQLYDKAIQLNP